nr:immunoglobulin light chain junction region [Macaca mulatta]
YMQALEFPPTF